MRRSIVWFRSDLRLHDNEALTDALLHNDEIIPLYVLDKRLLEGKTPYGFPKVGRFRLQFLLESLEDLRRNLRKAGSDLYFRIGIPEEIIPEIAQAYRTSYIYCNRERTQEEVDVQDKLERTLWSIGQEVRYYRGKMLYYTADLPFPITHCPDSFSTFRKEVEKFVDIRKPLPAPDRITSVNDPVVSDPFPVIERKQSIEERAFSIIGGETTALDELDYYLWKTNLVADYYNTRNGMLGRDYSSKLSASLALGCISPKQVYEELKKYELEVTENKSTYWLIFELMWRDFFRFMGKKHGNEIFLLNGYSRVGESTTWYHNKILFEKWTQGITGIPFVDANMRELNATGFMSNRGRQNVASFLINDLKINWVWGAEYFESLLIDYDPCSNYGNWTYLAGVGSDPRKDRYFNIPSQAHKYDPNGDYIRTWIPELATAPLEFLYNPFSCELDRSDTNYPFPCIEVKQWMPTS